MRFFLAGLVFVVFAAACPAADPDLDATMYQLNQERYYLIDKEKSLSREYSDLMQRSNAIKMQMQQLAQELEGAQARLQSVKHDLISVQMQLR